MSTLINAIKDQVVGSIQQGYGYVTGNEEMQNRGRETFEHGRNDASNFYESSAEIHPTEDKQQNAEPRQESSNRDSTSSWFGSTTTGQDSWKEESNEKEKSSTSGNSSSWVNSLNPSLFVRNKGGDPSESAHGDMKDQMHSQPMRETTWDKSEQPSIVPLRPHENFHPSGIAVDPNPERKDSSSTEPSLMEKIGAIMSGNRDTFDPSRDLREEPSWKKDDVQDNSSVIEKLRDAHHEAVFNNNNNQPTSDHSFSSNLVEKFDDMKSSVSSFFTDREDSRPAMDRAADNQKSMTESVKETVMDVKDNVSEFVTETKNEAESAIEKLRNAHNDAISNDASNMMNPLPLKTSPDAVSPNNQVPDTNFLQNA